MAIKQMTQPRYSSTRQLSSRVPFYWKHAGALQRIIAYDATHLAHAPTLFLAAMGTFYAIETSLFFLFMLIPFLFWTLPILGIIAYISLMHQPLSQYDWSNLGVNYWFQISEAKQQEFRPIVKALREQEDIDTQASREFKEILRAYAQPIHRDPKDQNVLNLIDAAKEQLKLDREVQAVMADMESKAEKLRDEIQTKANRMVI